MIDSVYVLEILRKMFLLLATKAGLYGKLLLESVELLGKRQKHNISQELEVKTQQRLL